VSEHTALDGALIRWSKDVWAWRDHAPAPEVKDITPSWYYNFRVQSGCVEVPKKLLATEPELSWVASYPQGESSDHYGERTIHQDGRQTRRSQSGKAIPTVYLVPVEDWDEWDAKTCIGAKWDKSEEAKILKRAKELNESTH
jgi:hypothetical protein